MHFCSSFSPPLLNDAHCTTFSYSTLLSFYSRLPPHSVLFLFTLAYPPLVFAFSFFILLSFFLSLPNSPSSSTIYYLPLVPLPQKSSCHLVSFFFRFSYPSVPAPFRQFILPLTLDTLNSLLTYSSPTWLSLNEASLIQHKISPSFSWICHSHHYFGLFTKQETMSF